MANLDQQAGKWATNEALGKIYLSVGVGVLIALFVAYSVGRSSGYADGVRIGYDNGWQVGWNEGHKQGEILGKELGEKNGYVQGYEDKTQGLPSKAEEKEWVKLAENRYGTKATYMYIASLLVVLFSIYWASFIYLKDAESRESFPGWIYLRTVVEKLKEKSYRYTLISKVLLSVLTLIIAWILVPGYLLAWVSEAYVNEISSESLVVATGFVFSGVLVVLIELSTAYVKSKSFKFWMQILWAGIFSILLYQFVGSLAATHGAGISSESAVKMLLFQTGISIGMAAYLFSRFSYSAFMKLRLKSYKTSL